MFFSLNRSAKKLNQFFADKSKRKLLLIILIPIILVFFVLLIKLVYPQLFNKIISYLFVNLKIIDFLSIIVAALLILFICFSKLSVLEKIVKYRYVIIIFLFAILVLLKVNMSSIDGGWGALFKDSTGTVINNGIITGTSRSIRFDEWFVQTPYLLTQSLHGYPAINTSVGFDGQSMLMVPGLVTNITLIGRPDCWGFFLLGTDYGYSWHWCFPILLLFIVSYELCFFLSKKNIRLSILGAFWITLSPIVQWMMQGVTGSIHPILWSECIIVSLLFFFQEVMKEDKNIIKELLLGLFLLISLDAFILNLYPAWQIPVAYIIIAFIISFIIMLRKEAIKLKLPDIIILSSSILLAVSVIFWFYENNKDIINIIMNTSYPGTHITYGGDYSPLLILKEIASIALPYSDASNSSLSNNCYGSAFICFLPLVLMAFPFLIKKINEFKPLVIILFIILLLQISWLVVPYPDWFGSITFFKYVKTWAIMYPIGQISTYLCIIFISTLQDNIRLEKWKITVIVLITLLCYAVTLFCSDLVNYMGKFLSITILIVYLLIILSICNGWKKTFYVILLTLIFLSGATVNPIRFGLSSIFGTNESKAITQIVKTDPNAKWIGLDYLNSQFLLANGANTINAVQYYPHLGFWSQFDPSGQYREIYNRYASIVINLTLDKTTFERHGSDSFIINMNINDLAKTDASYILVGKDISSLNSLKVQFEKIYYSNIDNMFIYKIHYIKS